jgi:predicted O-methyltransferase YrrM
MTQTSGVSAGTALKAVIKKLPVFDRIVSVRDRLRLSMEALFGAAPFVPPGHFHSPIPSLDEIRRDESRIFERIPRSLGVIYLQEQEQLSLLDALSAFYAEMPFRPHKAEGLRYYFENTSFGYSDAILLYCLLRFLKPARVIEVGSGFSSSVMLDTNERFLGGAISLTFIDPHPDRLLSLMTDAPAHTATLLPFRLQDVDLSTFDALQANDILFIDSTHVGKIDSDVNHLFFEILPRLNPGVYVHVHDIIFPFEYPKVWVYEGRAWNEAYLLRAFLQYNSAFRVVLMNTFMERFHAPFFREKMPLCLMNTGGSLWMRKERP